MPLWELPDYFTENDKKEYIRCLPSNFDSVRTLVIRDDKPFSRYQKIGKIHAICQDSKIRIVYLHLGQTGQTGQSNTLSGYIALGEKRKHIAGIARRIGVDYFFETDNPAIRRHSHYTQFKRLSEKAVSKEAYDLDDMLNNAVKKLED